MLATPDRSKAFLLDTRHGDVIPVNLVSGHVGAPIAVGKLPVDEEMSADGSTLYVTDNLGGTVIPINTADRTASSRRRPLTQGVDFYVPSPLGVERTGRRQHLGQATRASCTSTTQRPAPARRSRSAATRRVRASTARTAPTVWIVEDGSNGQPGVLIPIDVATQKPGSRRSSSGSRRTAYAVTPNGETAVFANEATNTVSIVDLVTHAVLGDRRRLARRPPASPSMRRARPRGSPARSTHARPGQPRHPQGERRRRTRQRAGDVALPATAGVAWVLFPSSNGSINFLSGMSGPLRRSIPVGNGPELLIGTGSETSWVANSHDEHRAADQRRGPVAPVRRSRSATLRSI